MTERAFHPVANIFPLLTGDAFDALVSDIAEHGLREPILLHPDGTIIDGRNRYLACIEAGMEPHFRTWTEDGSLVAFVVSLNLHRRHLDESQRAMVGAKIATLERGANQHAQTCAPSQSEAADLLNVSRRSVQSAREVLEAGTPELVSAVESGVVSVSAAADVAALEPEEQREVVARGEKEILRAAKEIRAKKAAERVEQRRAMPAPDLPAGLFRVFYADPPWSYGNTLPEHYGEVSKHYGSMTIEELCALPVASMAAPDAVLFLWVTSPLLEESFRVISAWGFTYKASFVWDKVKHNFGHYNSVRHEFLLVCTRGSCTPDVAKLYDSVVSVERTERHSAKPAVFREIIEALYPKGERLELFARERAAGWEVYGNECD